MRLRTDMGKFMNGYTITSYDPMPKGWDFADMLVGLNEVMLPEWLR